MTRKPLALAAITTATRLLAPVPHADKQADAMDVMEGCLEFVDHDGAQGAQIIAHSAARDCLGYLRRTMGKASEDMVPFEEAYASTDWSAYERMPMFPFANRMNAYNTYLLMEQEGLRGK